jgi:hypothetical protein
MPELRFDADTAPLASCSSKSQRGMLFGLQLEQALLDLAGFSEMKHRRGRYPTG